MPASTVAVLLVSHDGATVAAHRPRRHCRPASCARPPGRGRHRQQGRERRSVGGRRLRRTPGERTHPLPGCGRRSPSRTSRPTGCGCCTTTPPPTPERSRPSWRPPRRTRRHDVLGPKLREWPSLRRLLEVGVTLSGTGARETGLERGEYDQGQHDDVRRVLAVNTAGMLVRRTTLVEFGRLRRLPPDLRERPRLRLAGGRVRAARPSWCRRRSSSTPRPPTGACAARRSPGGTSTTRSAGPPCSRCWRTRPPGGCRSRCFGSGWAVCSASSGSCWCARWGRRSTSWRRWCRSTPARVSSWPPAGRDRVAATCRPDCSPRGGCPTGTGSTWWSTWPRPRPTRRPTWPSGDGRPRPSASPRRLHAVPRPTTTRTPCSRTPGSWPGWSPTPWCSCWGPSSSSRSSAPVTLFGAVTGPGSVPGPRRCRGLVGPARPGVARARPGHAGAGPGLCPALAVLAVPLGPDGAVSALLVLAVPLSLWGAWRFLRVVGRLVSTRGRSTLAARVGAATTTPCCPCSVRAGARAGSGTVVTAMLCRGSPMRRSGSPIPEPDRRWRAAWRVSMLLALITAFAPVAWLVVAAAAWWCWGSPSSMVPSAVPVPRRSGAPPVVGVLSVPVLLVPWWLPALREGASAGLLLDAGPVPSAVWSRLDLLSGPVGVAVAALAVLALVPSRTRIPVLVCWVVVLVTAVTGRRWAASNSTSSAPAVGAGLGVGLHRAPGRPARRRSHRPPGSPGVATP